MARETSHLHTDSITVRVAEHIVVFSSNLPLLLLAVAALLSCSVLLWMLPSVAALLLCPVLAFAQIFSFSIVHLHALSK